MHVIKISPTISQYKELKKNDTPFFSLTIFLAGFLLLAISGCDSNNVTGPGNGNGNGNGSLTNEVAIQGHSFSPSNIEVEVGTTVTWINNDNEVHTVTSGTGGQHDGQFDSGNMQSGEEYSYQFDEAGTYNYYCIPHVAAGMTGTVTVTNSGGGSGGGNGNTDDDDDDDNDYDGGNGGNGGYGY